MVPRSSSEGVNSQSPAPAGSLAGVTPAFKPWEGRAVENDAEQHRFYMLLGIIFFLAVAIMITAGLRHGATSLASDAAVAQKV